MKIGLALAISATLIFPAAAQQRARFLVCPPELDYCYYAYKPIYPKMRQEDREREILDGLACLKASNDRPAGVPFGAGCPKPRP